MERSTVYRNIFQHERLGLDVETLKHSLVQRLEYSIGKDRFTATPRDWFNALAYVTRDRLTERWMETMRTYYNKDAKRVYYLSLEFLIGRTLTNSLLNLDIYDNCTEALQEIGVKLEDILDIEPDAALGNGGLGRLAACFLDSMATLNLPGYGYGIRYEYGMFNQKIEKGFQIEHPDNWLRYSNPWEFPRAEVLYPVKFNGKIIQYPDDGGEMRYHWIETDDVMAMAYDTPIPGYKTDTVNNMRLWAAKSSRDFELQYFNQGDYIKAVESKNDSENISKVLYPDDTTLTGKTLRLKQQYFFVCASLQDILYRFKKHHDTFDELPNKVAIQLNDTHPAIAIPELMRILVDTHHLSWDVAWDITTRTFAYTNHTLMPEALETWPVKLFEKMLPRHLQIIYDINHHFLVDVSHHFPGNQDMLKELSIIDENSEKRIRMAHLAIVGSHKVNGVAELHTQLMKSTIFSRFNQHFPDKIINKTNGITPRRWLNQANKKLAQLITAKIGDEWVTDLDKLKALNSLKSNKKFQQEIQSIKQSNKQQLADMITKDLGIQINTESIFDIQVKRIHEYKRQLLNVLHIITLYNRIRHNPQTTTVPRTFIFAGKAAPAYSMAKLIIKLINNVADIVNNDPAIGDRIKVVFLPNYNVSAAQKIIPACDLSEQISTAGTEASGTSNMKFALNGALTIGTLDGANIEIREEVGEENIFIFGMTTTEIEELRANGYNPKDYYHANHELKEAIDMIGSGYFSPRNINLFQPVVDTLLNHGDQYYLLADFASYIACQETVSDLYLDPGAWTQKAISNIANMGKFSSDRTIDEYAKEIWNTKPVKVKL